MIKCDSCAWENPLHAAFCTNCGAELNRADMSLSADVSGSDELSLDGSESNLVAEAARDDGHQEAKSSPTVPRPNENADTLALDDHDQLSNLVDVDNQRTIDLDMDDSQGEPPLVDRATLQLNPNLRETAERAGADIAGESSARNADSEPEEDTSLGKSVTEEPQEFAYVAFDADIPLDDSIADASFRSLDIGVESLSLDDSLHLGPEVEIEPLPNKELEALGKSQSVESVASIDETAQDLAVSAPKTAGGLTVATRLRLMASDPDDEQFIDLAEAQHVLGRDGTDKVLADDEYISPRHCSISQEEGRYELSDLDSLNGTWTRIRATQVLQDGQQIRMGGQWFVIRANRFDTASPSPSDDGTRPLAVPSQASGWQIVSGGDTHSGCRHDVPSYGLRIGRLTGNLVFEDDLELDALHAVLLPTDDGVSFRDLESRFGSWLRVDGMISIEAGSEFLVGKTRLRLEI